MRDTAPDGTIGYVVVHLADRDVWQGIFVTSAFAAKGQALLDEARRDLAAAGPRGTVQERPGNVDLDPLDQPLVGLLSAAMAQLLDRMTADGGPTGERAAGMMDVMGSVGWALHEAAGRPWLLVHARRDPVRRGFVTRVEYTEAADLDAAREELVARVSRDRRVGDLARSFEEMVRAGRKRTSGGP